MDIKEIALKIGLQVFEEHPYDDGHVVSPSGYTWIDDKLIELAEALLSAYKAELLKEVGEPVLYAEFAEDGGWLGDASEYADHLEEPHALFTSDQVAAAIIKATKPLKEEIVKWREASRVKHIEAIDWAGKHQAISYELDELRAKLAAAQEEIERLNGQISVYRLSFVELERQRDVEMASATQWATGHQELRDQLAAAQEEIAFQKSAHEQVQQLLLEQGDLLAKAEQLWRVAQGRCDGLEEKLAKAEQRAEWQPIDTAPKDGSWFLGWRQYSTRPRLIQFDSDYEEFIDEDGNHVYSVAHWMPLPKAPNGASS